MAEPVLDSFYNSSSFELGNSISDLDDVDLELTFEDLYFPSENESFFIPIDATNLESSEATLASSSTSSESRKLVVVDQTLKAVEEAPTYKYRRLDEDGDEEDEEKRKARLIRNRESALLSRQRKKHYVEELEDKVKNLQSVITDLNSKVSYFMSENVTLRHKVGPGKGMCWPPSGMYPMPYTWMPFPAYMVKPHQVVPLLPIPRLKPPRSLATKVKKTEAKTKKVASVSVLGLLFCLFLFAALAPSGVFYDEVRGRVFDMSVNSSSSRASDQGVRRNVSVPLGNGSEQLVASLYVPRNEKLVKLEGNLIIRSLSASKKDISPALRLCESTRTKDMSKNLNTDSKEKLNSTTANGEMQQWFREGVAGPTFSSGTCTEVFQFDVSSTSGAIRHASRHPKNTTDTHKGKNNRRILRAVSDSNLTKDQNSSNKGNFSTTTKLVPSMVVSVLNDPREEGSDGDIDGVTEGPKSLSRVFIVVLVDDVKYVTYSCVLPSPQEVPHLVTT